jgi:predicted permease
LIEVLLVSALIAAATTAGILAERRLPGGGQPVARGASRFLLWGLTPVIYFFVVARLKLDAGVGVGLLLAYVELAIVGVLAYVAATRWLHLTRPQTGALIVVVILANTGYVGLPLVATLLGADQLGPAIAWDSVVSAPMFLIVAMTIGATMGDRPSDGPGAHVAAVLRNPPLIAVVLGLVAPDALAPDALLDVAHALVYVTIPVAFFIVGLTLGGESEEGSLTFPPALTRPVGVALVLRMVVAPLLMLGLATAIIAVPHAYLLQAATPAGANSVVVGHLYGLDLKITASAVAWSTMIAVVLAIAIAPLL